LLLSYNSYSLDQPRYKQSLPHGRSATVKHISLATVHPLNLSTNYQFRFHRLPISMQR